MHTILYKAGPNEIKEIWEEREPIDDFVFDTEPIVYITKSIKK